MVFDSEAYTFRTVIPEEAQFLERKNAELDRPSTSGDPFGLTPADIAGGYPTHPPEGVKRQSEI